VRRCRIQGIEPPTQAEVFEGSSVEVGALPENDFVVRDTSVSRRHCRIQQEPEGYVVVDLESTNGTFVNGVRVREAFLPPGCVVRVGKAQLRFEAGDEELEVHPVREQRQGEAVGGDIRMRELFAVVRKIAPTAATVVIQGETGTGKELVARNIHELSDRSARPFVVFDCGAVPSTLIESELFGHERGSFTGAVMMRRGVAESAHTGTLFLDEVGELSLELQPKLLRFLERREVRRVGGLRPIKVDVRVVAATNRDLEQEVAAGRFREDLYYRLSVVRLDVPPLRKRRKDIGLLVKHFLSSCAFNRDGQGKLRVRGVAQKALEALSDYPWPGNVRELLNVVERACSFSDSRMIQLEDLPESVRKGGSAHAPGGVGADSEGPPDLPFKEAKQQFVDGFEREYLERLLEENDWNISQAAREAEIDRKYLGKLLRKHDLKRPS
jgi:transcriptional regulator with GAF, ATPase, and Fis domain